MYIIPYSVVSIVVVLLVDCWCSPVKKSLSMLWSSLENCSITQHQS